MRLSLERSVSLGSSWSRVKGRQHSRALLAWREEPSRGQESTAYGYRGHPRNLGDPAISAEEKSRSGSRLTKDPGLRPGASTCRKSEGRRAHRRYGRDKGNRARWDG